MHNVLSLKYPAYIQRNLIPNRQNHTKMGVKAYLCIKKPISTQFSKLYFKLAYIKIEWFFR